jgi:hypothetical protein
MPIRLLFNERIKSMDITYVDVDHAKRPTRPAKLITRKRLTMGVAALVLAGGSIIAANSVPAHASQVNNNMLCEPDTAWCYQTNPPYNPNFPHACQWDYELHNLHSGMYYTGCAKDFWGPTIH